MSKNNEVEPNVSIEISTKGEAVKDGSVSILVTRLGFWMDARAGGNSMRTGYQAVPFGQLRVNVPVEGLKEGKEVSCEDMSKILEANLSNLFPVVRVFEEESLSDF